VKSAYRHVENAGSQLTRIPFHRIWPANAHLRDGAAASRKDKVGDHLRITVYSETVLYACCFTLSADASKKLVTAFFQKQMASYELLIVDELGFVPLSKTGAELLFEVFSLRYERGSTLVTSNLPFQEWTEVLGSERLTGALLDRLTHHVHILEMNGESYRLKQSKHKRNPQPGR
jgi:IstB-like ATP binding protein